MSWWSTAETPSHPCLRGAEAIQSEILSVEGESPLLARGGGFVTCIVAEV